MIPLRVNRAIMAAFVLLVTASVACGGGAPTGSSAGAGAPPAAAPGATTPQGSSGPAPSTAPAPGAPAAPVAQGQGATPAAKPAVATKKIDAVPGPILLLGVDGLEWRVMLPMIRAGEMPVLAGLMKRGSFGRLSTIRPTISQIIWTSIATGKSPAKHGIDALLKKTDGGRGQRLFSGEDRRTKALWNIFSDYGLTVNSIGWWKTWPAEEITGVMVPQLNLLYSFDASGLGIFQPDRARSLQDLVQPPAFLDKVDSTAREVDGSVGSIAGKIFGRFRHPQSEFGKYALPRMRWILAMDEMHYRLARDVLSERGPGDLTMVYFRGADVLAHAFWRFTYPEGFADQPTKDEIENYAGIIPGYYRHVDSLLGSLIEAVGQGATVIVVSDHGMGPSNVNASFTPGQGSKPASKSGDHEDAPPGIFIAAGPYIGTGVPGGREAGELPAALDYATLPKVGSVYDLTPTILALKGLPVGKDMDGKVLDAILVPSFLKAHPVATVATHDTGGWPAGRADYHLSDEQVKERIEELRSIGYIE